MSDQQIRDMVIKHDEQLKALPDLIKAVQDLTVQIAIANAKTYTAVRAAAIVGTVTGFIITTIIGVVTVLAMNVKL